MPKISWVHKLLLVSMELEPLSWLFKYLNTNVKLLSTWVVCTVFSSAAVSSVVVALVPASSVAV